MDRRRLAMATSFSHVLHRQAHMCPSCNARFQAHINAHMHIHLHEGHTALSQAASTQDVRIEHQDHIGRHQEKSRFLQLPGEIRNRIYEYVLDDYSIIALDHISLARDDTSKHIQIPSIIEICQQIREEAIGIWLSSTTFLFNFHGELYDFLRMLGPRRAAMMNGARETYVWQNQSQAECSLRQFRKGLVVLGIELSETAVGVQFVGEKGEIDSIRRIEEGCSEA